MDLVALRVGNNPKKGDSKFPRTGSSGKNVSYRQSHMTFLLLDESVRVCTHTDDDSRGTTKIKMRPGLLSKHRERETFPRDRLLKTFCNNAKWQINWSQRNQEYRGNKKKTKTRDTVCYCKTTQPHFSYMPSPRAQEAPVLSHRIHNTRPNRVRYWVLFSHLL